MNLMHECPECGKEHEMEATPEPDQPCPECNNESGQFGQEMRVYDLYDLSGKVMETRAYQKALAWKKWGETHLFHGRKRRYIKTRIVKLRIKH